MFEQKTVTNCPITAGSLGRVIIPPTLLAELVGTLDREAGQEWLVLLHGTREEGGLIYRISHVTVPGNQLRHSSEVELPDYLVEDDEQGVLHSHHNMGASMSGTDKTKLNPRFGISIVISTQLQTDEHRVLGFAYEAVGHVKLPCGAMGHIKFGIEPEGVEDWPFYLPYGFKADPKFVGLGDCSKNLVDRSDDTEFYETVTTIPACNFRLSAVVQKGPKIAAFGRGGDAISKLLPPPVSPVVGWSQSATGSVKVRDRRRYRQGDSENYYGNYYGSVEFDPGDIETRQECSWCKSWEPVSELLDCEGHLFCDDCYDYLAELQKLEGAVIAGGYDAEIEWAGRHGELEEKHWGGHYV